MLAPFAKFIDRDRAKRAFAQWAQQAGIDIEALSLITGISIHSLGEIIANPWRSSISQLAVLAAAWNVPWEQMLATAGHMPPDILAILWQFQDEIFPLLRRRYGDKVRRMTRIHPDVVPASFGLPSDCPEPIVGDDSHSPVDTTR